MDAEPAEYGCQLWTDVRSGLLAAFSLHPPGAAAPALRGAPPPDLVPAGRAYRVEALPGDRGADPPGRLVPGLPALTLVDPPGVVALLSHLPWDAVLDRSDAYWNAARGGGVFRFPRLEGAWTRRSSPPSALSQAMSDYASLVRRLRRERGTHLVKVTGPPPAMRGQVQALFARRTPEELLDELRVAQVMEA